MVITDTLLKSDNIYYKYHSDLKNGIGTSKDGSTSRNAYVWFNDHYANAIWHYAHKNYLTAYEELGRSIHYLEDINAPHHAMLRTTKNSNHAKYERWVKEHFLSMYWEYDTAKDSYPFVCNSTFRYMSNSFSKAACSQYYACDNYASNYAKARTATAELTKRSQRAVAGLLYRFLADTGRAK